MIHLHIPRLKEPLNGDMPLGIRALAVLLLPQLEFHQILSRGAFLAVFRADALHDPLVAGAVFIHILFHLAALRKIAGHLPRQLDVDKGRTSAAFPDNGVKDFHRLRDRTPHNRACHIREIILRRVEKARPRFTVMPLEIISCGGAGFIVFHPLFQERDQLIAGLYGKVAEFAEAHRLGNVDLYLRQPCRSQAGTDVGGSLISGENASQLILLLTGQAIEMIFGKLVESRPHLVIGSEIAELRFLFRLLIVLRVLIEHRIKGRTRGDPQFLANTGEIQILRLMCQCDKRLPLCAGKRAAFTAGHQPQVVDILEQRKILKGIAGLCCARLSRLQRTLADHLLDLASAIGAALSGAFVKGALTQKYFQILLLQLCRRKGLPLLTLSLKDGADLFLHHVPSHSRKVFAALIALISAVLWIFQQHFPHRAVALFGHERTVGRYGGKQLAVLLRCAGLAVGLETAPLRDMQKDTGKSGVGHWGIQRLDAQRVNILQFSLEKGIQLRLRYYLFRCQKAADAFQAVLVPAQAAARTSRLTPGCRQRIARFGLLGGVKNAGAHVDDAERPVLSIQSDDRPAYRCDTNVKTDGVWIHSMSSSYSRIEITPRLREALELCGVLPYHSNLHSSWYGIKNYD